MQYVAILYAPHIASANTACRRCGVISLIKLSRNEHTTSGALMSTAMRDAVA